MLYRRRLLSFLLSSVVLLSPFSLASVETEQEYDLLLMSFEHEVSELSSALLGQQLIAVGNWEKEYDPTRAAASNFRWNDGTIGVYISGWLARWPDFYSDEIQLVLCHEMGHLVHGLGNEYESDYFATSQCLSYLWNGQDHFQRHPENIDEILSADIIDACDAQDASGYCLRAMVSAVRTNNFRRWAWEEINLSESRINSEYECRQQLFISGALGNTMYQCCYAVLGNPALSLF